MLSVYVFVYPWWGSEWVFISELWQQTLEATLSSYAQEEHRAHRTPGPKPGPDTPIHMHMKHTNEVIYNKSTHKQIVQHKQ